MGKGHRLKPTRADAEKAVRTLIAWAGDDPDREGLRETPVRVTRAYEEWFVGYHQNPEQMLRRTFGEVAGYDEMVTLRDIPFESFLRTPFGSAHRVCSRRVFAQWTRGRNLEACAGRGCIR